MSFESTGKYFGFPECCIESFAKLKHLDNRAAHEHELLGTGFVPCAICASTKTADELRAEIAVNRECPVPFPDGDREYLRSIGNG